MIKFLDNQKGFTLVELIIGMAIMTIIMAGIFGLLSVSIKSYQFSQKRIYEVQQSRTAINSIIDDLRTATAITALAGDSITYTTNSNSYTIKMGSEQNSGKLMKNSTAITSNVVKRILFARDSNDGRILKITITLNSPDNKSSGDFVIDSVVFTTNLSK